MYYHMPLELMSNIKKYSITGFTSSTNCTQYVQKLAEKLGNGYSILLDLSNQVAIYNVFGNTTVYTDKNIDIEWFLNALDLNEEKIIIVLWDYFKYFYNSLNRDVLLNILQRSKSKLFIIDNNNNDFDNELKKLVSVRLYLEDDDLNNIEDIIATTQLNIEPEEE